tara:strand:- start:414 stop:911 length:498 start_codon:yes stop_codon:yes gene_type:complete
MENKNWANVPGKINEFVAHVLKGQKTSGKTTFDSIMLGLLVGITLVQDAVDNLGRLFLEDSSLWLGNACIILSMIAQKFKAPDDVKDVIGNSVPQTPFGHKYMVEHILRGNDSVHLSFQPGWKDGNSFITDSVKKHHITIEPDPDDTRFAFARIKQGVGDTVLMA